MEPDCHLLVVSTRGKHGTTNAARQPVNHLSAPGSPADPYAQTRAPASGEADRSARAPETGSAGRPPEQPLDAPALAFSRTARAAVADSHRHSLLAGQRGRAVVDIAPSGNGCADTLGDDLLDDHDAFASFVAQPHLITGPYGMRGLDPHPIDPDVPGPAGTGRGRAGLGQPYRPDPAVHPPGLITCHSAHCNAIRGHR